MKRVVTFGEIMLRLCPPGHELFLQTPVFNVSYGGAEANVAVALSNFGMDAAFVTALPKNALGDAAVRELRKFGVDTRHILRTEGRMGLYFTQKGSCCRPSQVLYDRADSAVSRVSRGDYDWNVILEGASWFHVTGITPALSGGAADATLEALEACRAKGIPCSCDLNYRKKLWKWGKKPTEVMPQVARMVNLLIANEEDCQKTLGMELDVDVAGGGLDGGRYHGLALRVLDDYPNLEYVAVSLRESLGADHNVWSGMLADREDVFFSRKIDLTHIVDRIGGGDSFGAGLIWGLQELGTPAEALEFAVAASALKHTLPGDFNLVSLEEIRGLMGGDTSGRVQR